MENNGEKAWWVAIQKRMNTVYKKWLVLLEDVIISMSDHSLQHYVHPTQELRVDTIGRKLLRMTTYDTVDL